MACRRCLPLFHSPSRGDVVASSAVRPLLRPFCLPGHMTSKPMNLMGSQGNEDLPSFAPKNNRSPPNLFSNVAHRPTEPERLFKPFEEMLPIALLTHSQLCVRISSLHPPGASL